MKVTASILTLAAALAVAAPAAAAVERDPYHGKAKGAGRVAFDASSTTVLHFKVEQLPVRCKPGGSGRARGRFKAMRISSDGHFKRVDKERTRVQGGWVKYRNTLRGSFRKRRSQAYGSMRFRTRGKVNGKRIRCQTKRLRWSAERRGRA